MGHPFEQWREAEVPASPAEVWEAIASGAGITSWFMGRSEVEAGVVRTAFGAYRPEMPIRVRDRPRRFAYGSPTAPDGRFIAYEFIIQARRGGTTLLRAVTSGFLPGEDWADEYEAMTGGGDLYFRTLVEYLTRFAARVATPVTAFGPEGAEWERTLAGIRRALGLSAGGRVGAAVRGHLEGIGAITGEVYFSSRFALGVRTEDALLRFIRGFGKGHVVAHLFYRDDVDAASGEALWGEMLARWGR